LCQRYPLAVAARQRSYLRLRGKGLPSDPPGDLYAVLEVVLPPSSDPKVREHFTAMAREVRFDPRARWGR